MLDGNSEEYLVHDHQYVIISMVFGVMAGFKSWPGQSVVDINYNKIINYMMNNFDRATFCVLFSDTWVYHAFK